MVEVFSGVVDTDRYPSPVNFPFVPIGADGVHILPKGTPLVQVIPFARAARRGEVRAETEAEAGERERVHRNTLAGEGWYRAPLEGALAPWGVESASVERRGARRARIHPAERGRGRVEAQRSFTERWAGIEAAPALGVDGVDLTHGRRRGHLARRISRAQYQPGERAVLLENDATRPHSSSSRRPRTDGSTQLRLWPGKSSGYSTIAELQAPSPHAHRCVGGVPAEPPPDGQSSPRRSCGRAAPARPPAPKPQAVGIRDRTHPFDSSR